MKKGICKLCLNEKPLLKKSHIIPDFIYRDGNIYHTDHSIQKINLAKALKGISNKKSRQYSGEYEGNILCQHCDGIIIKCYEDYAKKVIWGSQKLSPDEAFLLSFPPGEVVMKNIDYKKIKLFFLSILWRAAISTRPFFKEVNFEMEKLEELRRMILFGDPKENLDWLMLFMLDCGKDTKLKQYIAQPVRGRDAIFVFTFPALLVVYCLDASLITTELKKYSIFKIGKMRLMKLSSSQIWDLFLNHLSGCS